MIDKLIEMIDKLKEMIDKLKDMIDNLLITYKTNFLLFNLISNLFDFQIRDG